MTPHQIAANIPALPDGWTPKDDLALWEALFLGLSLAAIADRTGHTDAATRARFFALKAASGAADRGMTPQEQRAVLDALRERAAQLT